MKILHTADWHLGRRLHGQDLTEDHALILDEIVRIIDENEVEVLIHAGDVFDSANPPHDALKQYYSFLIRAQKAGCTTIVITGGNHDSPTALNAPQHLLEEMNIHVVGCATETIEKEIIPLREKNGAIRAYCCAVPFLRDKDLRYSLPGETDTDRSKRLVEGIQAHYHNVFEAVCRVNPENLPVIATGHLFAQGGMTGDLDTKEQIHVGNLGQIGADSFPLGFAYVALGHLHRPQIVGKRDHIRYSGSPLPLDFSERNDGKQVVLVECCDNTTITVKNVTLPTFRQLVRFTGTIQEIEGLIQTFNRKDEELTTFAEVHITPDAQMPLLDANEHFRTFAKERFGDTMVILRVVQPRLRGDAALNNDNIMHLEEYTRLDVFREKLKKSGIQGEEAKECESTFIELLALLNEGTLSV